MTNLVIQIIMFYNLCDNIVIYPLLIKIRLAFVVLMLLENPTDFLLLPPLLFTFFLCNWSTVIFGDHPMSLLLMAFYTILFLLMFSFNKTILMMGMRTNEYMIKIMHSQLKMVPMDEIPIPNQFEDF